jgi:hypothetical protein
MHSAVSEALVVEKEIIHNSKIAKQQLPMYFVSEVLKHNRNIRKRKGHGEIRKSNCGTSM